MIDKTNPNSEFILYNSEDDQTNVECRFNEAALSQEATRKFRIIRMEGELMENSVVWNFRTTESGKLYRVYCYDFNVITSIANRIKPAPEYLAEAA